MPLLLLLFCLAFALPAQAEEGWHLDYIREVSNELQLADFQLGSSETIRDYKGHGFALGRISGEGKEFWNIELGSSSTKYQGEIEDGVSVSFAPTEGSGYEALSTSNNIIYDVDLEFDNRFVGVQYTNWEWFGHQIEASRFGGVATFGLGLINQSARGDVTIRAIDGTEIAQAHYQSSTQRYFSLGWSFHFDFLFVDLGLRHVTSPALVVDSCNQEAVGQTVCERIQSAAGNRNQSTQLFTGGVLKVGVSL